MLKLDLCSSSVWSCRDPSSLLPDCELFSGAMHHGEEQTRRNQVEGPSGLFIIQETGCKKHFNYLGVGKRAGLEGGRGGVKDERGVSEWKESRLPSHHRCERIMQPMNWKKKPTTTTCKHTQTLIKTLKKNTELVVSLQWARKYKKHNNSL